MELSAEIIGTTFWSLRMACLSLQVIGGEEAKARAAAGEYRYRYISMSTALAPIGNRRPLQSSDYEPPLKKLTMDHMKL